MPFTAPLDPVRDRWEEAEPCWPSRFVLPLAGSNDSQYSVCLDVRLDVPTQMAEFTREDWERLACLLLVSRLQARGLSEAVQSLRDMVEFYAEEPAPALPPPIHSVPAKVSRSYTSTVPPITEE